MGFGIPKEAFQYKNQWVALSCDFERVVGHGLNPEDALAQAEEAHEENAILHFILDPGLMSLSYSACHS